MLNDPVFDLVSKWPFPSQVIVSPLAQQIAQLSPEMVAESLRARFARLAKIHRFEPGQLVKWKEGMKHLTFPAASRPSIVVEVLQEPVVNQFVGPDSPYFGEILDLRVGVIADDGTFYVYMVPSLRFEPFNE